jgi:hypothetical protein
MSGFKLGTRRRDYEGEITQRQLDLERWQREHARRTDQQFQRALMKAAARGKERVRQGTFVDPTPFTGRMIHPEPFYSGCSSAALACADAPGSEREFSDSV